MIPRDNRRQPGGRGGRGGKPERSSSRQPVPPSRSAGNAPVMGTVIGFAPPAATTAPALNERFLFAFQVLVGYTVEVQVKAGGTYQGIFHTAQLENSELHVVLCMAKLTKDAEQQPVDGAAGRRPIKELIIKSADLISLTAKDIRMGADDVSRPAEDAFSTDTAISRGRGGLAGRELQKWAPETSDALSGMLLESDAGSKGKGSTKWDQFAANQQLFGTATSYNEDLYTTKLDKGASAISVQEAERLAAEIQGGATSNPHVAEERGALMDSGMNEEDLYSAVGRQSHAAEADEQEDATEEDEALNADTFGDSALGCDVANNGAAPARPAWTTAGATTALLSASNRVDNQEQASSSRGSVSQPIDMSMRAEHNKVRTHLAGSKKDRSSPYGTPIAKSPLSSPLIADAAALEALNLNPGSAKFDTGTLRSFQEYKLQQAAKKAAQQRSPRISPSAISMSPSETSVLDHVDPLREEDSDLFGAAAGPTPRKPSPGSATSSAAASTPASVSAPTAPAAAAADREASAGAGAAETSGGSANAAIAGVVRPDSAGTSGNAMGDDSSTAQPAGTPKSKLNPFAREFKLNVKAPSFTPASKPSGSALPPGGAGQGPGPVPAASLPPSQPSGGPRPRAAYSQSHTQAYVGSSAEERQSRPVSASHHAASRGTSQGRPASSPPGRRGLSPAPSGGHMASRRQPYMQSSEQIWAQSQGMHMHMPGGRPSGHMAMQAGMPLQMSGGYMVPAMMPGMMPGMPMMGPGSPDQMMGYIPNNMRPYSQAMGYGVMPGQYGVMYGHQMNQSAPNARPPMYSQGYQAPMHPNIQQMPLNQAK
ncbi:hypothetical protein WJX77_004980 [Trebouxia sp. C0004]